MIPHLHGHRIDLARFLSAEVSGSNATNWLDLMPFFQQIDDAGWHTD